MRRICLLFFFLFPLSSPAQYLTAYEDFRKYFYVFENGATQQAEQLQVRQYVISGNAVLYINNANELRCWINGQKFRNGEGLNATLYSTGNMLFYTRDQALTVIYKGELFPLTFFLSEYKAGDNIIAFKDSRYDILKAYYNGQIHELEYTLVSKLGNYQVGDNIIAYVNGSHYFKVFTNGEIFELSTWEPQQFACGKNMVAYVDGSSNELNLFYSDKIVKLESFPPLSMQMGDNIFAYVSDESVFKVFTNGKLLKLESYQPDMYKVKDNILCFYAENKFQVIYNGTRYELETFMPRNYTMSNNCLAYTDHAGRLKLFNEGKTTTVTTETVTSFELNGNVLKYYVGDNTAKVYWNGKNF